MWLIWIRRGLLGLSLIFASSLVYVLVSQTDSGSSTQPNDPNLLSEGDAGMKEFTFFHSKDGIVQWEVRADRAKMFEKENKAVLDQVHITLLGKQGREMVLEGEEGTINTASRDFVLTNRSENLSVELEGGYTLYTNHLAWTDNRREFSTNDPVFIVGNGMKINGLGLIGKLDSEEFQIQKNVQVEIIP